MYSRNKPIGNRRPGPGNSFVLLAVLAACTSDTELQPFTSDGCSLFPDTSLISEEDWCSCCFQHDLAYWRGGTRAERENADRELAECVLARTGNAALAALMHQGVRVGGSPYFYNWYRWGYGWTYERKYQALTPQEHAQADRLLERYFESAQGSVCPND